MADILVVKVNMFLRPKEMDNISNYIRVENTCEMKGENHE